MDSIVAHILTRSELNIRHAEPGDRPALEAIAAQTWDGDDYLPRVLDVWFADPHDGFYVATFRDQVVGVTKLTRFAEGEWWLEGLRVDPAFQGRGISRILHHFVINEARQHREGVIRFSTASLNEAVHKLAAQTGFEFKAAYLGYSADPLAEPVATLRQLAADDGPRVRAWLAASAHFARAQRSIEYDWSFYFLTDARLAERLQAGLVYGWPGEGDQLGGVLIVNPLDNDRWPGGERLKLAYCDVPASDLAACYRAARRLAAALGRGGVRIKAYKDPVRIQALEQAGYEREWEGETWLYARDLNLTQHADVRIENLPPAEDWSEGPRRN